MAKKTNKTDHVLNLLSAGEEEQVTETATEPKAAVVKNENGDEGLAEAIKDSLEEEISAEETVTEEVVEQEEVVDSVSAEEAVADEDDFVIINVMEQLVADKVHYYMKKLEMCECRRCAVDVSALALTRLGSKYVVAKRTEVSPLINYYSRKYEGPISIELMKACKQVMETPRHADN